MAGLLRSHANIATVLAALNFGAVALGVAAGGLTASIVGLAVSGLLTIIGVDGGADIGLVIGILSGLFAGGWLAGGRSVHSHRFHGMVTGLALAFGIVVIARLGGSPAETLTVVWLAVLSIVVSGLSGWLAGRRRHG
ncbi:MAG TPA: hypothetical protein VF115_04175 [Acidimicrobiia bacterium]